MNDEEKTAVEIMINAAKDAEYLEDAMLLGYRALKEHKYPKPPEIDMSKVQTAEVDWDTLQRIREYQGLSDRYHTMIAQAQAREQEYSRRRQMEAEHYHNYVMSDIPF